MKANEVHLGMGALAFMVEMLALVALARWGWTVHPLLGAVLPLAFALCWGAFLAPRAARRLPFLSAAAVKFLLFALAAYGAAQVWGQAIALAFLTAALVVIFLPTLHQGEPA